MLVRIRLPEVLDEHKPKKMTAYAAAKASNGKIIPSTLYRLVRRRGRVRLFDSDLLEALCHVLKIKPGELLELDETLEREKKRRAS